MISHDKYHNIARYIQCHITLYIPCDITCNIIVVWQGQGDLTYAGKIKSPRLGEHHYAGKEALDIHLLKAEQLEALPLDSDILNILLSDRVADPEWVTYPYRKAHPILRWLPSKLAEYLAETMAVDLEIPAKQGAKWTVAELNSILAKNLVPGRDGNHLRTFSTLQWESDDYLGRPKARCYPFDLKGHRFRGKNPQVINMIYTDIYNGIYQYIYILW